MKSRVYNVLLLLVIVGSLMMSAKSESPNQVILHSNDVNQLTRECNNWFVKGYRVKYTVGQSVGTSITEYFTSNGVDVNGRDIFGEVIIIMEK